MTLEGLYLNTTVPLPSRPLEIAKDDSQVAACEKLDRFFYDIIRHYPENIRELLDGMYRENKNVGEVKYKDTDPPEDRVEARVRFTEDKEGYTILQLLIDERICKSPIITRCFKIHHIAGAIGIMHERMQTASDAALSYEHSSGALEMFMHQACAPFDKMMMNALIEPLLGRELALIRDEEMREKMRAYISIKQSTNYNDYIQLKHLGIHVPAENHNLLHTRPELDRFGKWMYSDKTGPIELPAPRKPAFAVKKVFS